MSDLRSADATVKTIYTPLERAVEELRKRRADRAFMARVNGFVGENILEPLRAEPRAVLARYIASPTREYEQFLQRAQRTTLRPLLLEYSRDRFVARNWEKYYLCRLFFCKARQCGTTLISGTRRIIDFNVMEGSPFCDITTLWGEPLVALHHRLLRSQTMVPAAEIHDFSNWFDQNRDGVPHGYYIRYLALFLTNGILFENFLLHPRERVFTERVVIPAFQTIVTAFGCKPLVVRILDAECEDDAAWVYYDDSMKHVLPASRAVADPCDAGNAPFVI